MCADRALRASATTRFRVAADGLVVKSSFVNAEWPAGWVLAGAGGLAGEAGDALAAGAASSAAATASVAVADTVAMRGLNMGGEFLSPLNVAPAVADRRADMSS
ncbi:hypothetical protein GCM10027176_33000 [Actinoallomurus bryophytorum]